MMLLSLLVHFVVGGIRVGYPSYVVSAGVLCVTVFNLIWCSSCHALSCCHVLDLQGVCCNVCDVYYVVSLRWRSCLLLILGAMCWVSRSLCWIAVLRNCCSPSSVHDISCLSLCSGAMVLSHSIYTLLCQVVSSRHVEFQQGQNTNQPATAVPQ